MLAPDLINTRGYSGWHMVKNRDRGLHYWGPWNLSRSCRPYRCSLAVGKWVSEWCFRNQLSYAHGSYWYHIITYKFYDITIPKAVEYCIWLAAWMPFGSICDHSCIIMIVSFSVIVQWNFTFALKKCGFDFTVHWLSVLFLYIFYLGFCKQCFQSGFPISWDY